MAGLKEHIFLIGFMGCGKSTNAACLAEMTGARQVEMDQMIVENEGMAIADIFEEKGEAYFRELETELIKSFAIYYTTEFSRFASAFSSLAGRAGKQYKKKRVLRKALPHSF